MNAIVATGGRGGRLGCGQEPICKGLLRIDRRPLLYYQLEQIAAIGVGAVFLCVTRDSVAQDYERSIQLFPKNMRYITQIYHHGGHPLLSLRRPGLFEAVKGTPLIFTYDDLWYPSPHLRNLRNTCDRMNGCGATVQIDNPGDRRYEIRADGFVAGRAGPDGVYVGPPYVFSVEMVPVVFELALKNPPLTDRILDECVSRGVLYACTPTEFVNVNTADNLKTVTRNVQRIGSKT